MRLLVRFVVIISWISLTFSAQAATNCSREFEFIGATNEMEPMIWIGKRVGGECYYSALITIALTDSGARVSGTSSDYELDFDGVQLAVSRLRQLRTTAYMQIDSQCTPIAERCCVGTKTRAPELLDSLKQVLIDGEIVEASLWDRVMGNRGIELPTATVCRFELAACDPGGLYVDYEIERMFIFESLPYVLVFTRQRRLDFGLDQLHGYLLLKIIAGE